MPPYSHWVHQSFKVILHKYCDEFLASSDHGPEKTPSKLITQVSQEILDVAQRQVDASLPDNLEKVNVPLSTRGQVINRSVQCVHTWFYNYAGGNATQERPGKSKAETCGHPISSRTWTVKSVDEPPHQIRSYTLLFSLFLRFPYITDPPLSTSAPTRPHTIALALAQQSHSLI